MLKISPILILISFLFLKQVLPSSRITGGRIALYGEYPMVAQIYLFHNERHHCGGILITSRYVLTAAHCLTCLGSLPCWRLYGVLLGDISRIEEPTSPESRQTFKIGRFVKNENFIGSTLENDIGLIKLNKHARFSANVYPGPIATEPTPEGTDCDTVGWGYQRRSSDVLLATTVMIQKDSVCRRHHRFIPGKFVCAGDLSGYNDSCKGDSGGPLLCNRRIVGIVSFGRSCAEKGNAAGYTNVLYYKNWIREKMLQLDPLPNENDDDDASTFRMSGVLLILCVGLAWTSTHSMCNGIISSIHGILECKTHC